MMMGVQVTTPLEVKNQSALLTDFEPEESAKEQNIQCQLTKRYCWVIFHDTSEEVHKNFPFTLDDGVTGGASRVALVVVGGAYKSKDTQISQITCHHY